MKNSILFAFALAFPIKVGQIQLELKQNFKTLVGSRPGPLACQKRVAKQLIMTVHLLFMWSHIALCVKFGTSPFFLGFFCHRNLTKDRPELINYFFCSCRQKSKSVPRSYFISLRDVTITDETIKCVKKANKSSYHFKFWLSWKLCLIIAVWKPTAYCWDEQHRSDTGSHTEKKSMAMNREKGSRVEVTFVLLKKHKFQSLGVLVLLHGCWEEISRHT